MSEKIGVITVLYNSAPVLEDFFMTLDKQSYRDFVLYIVDNKSPDNSLLEAKRLSAAVSFRTVIIENEDNFGFAKGTNIGTKAAIADGCEFVLFSNNDIVLEPCTLELLAKGMEDMHARMAVPKIYFHDSGKIWAAGGYFDNSKGISKHYGILDDDDGRFDERRMVDFAPACFLLADSKVFDKIGFFDENYFVYYEDTDLMWRANKAGIKLAYIPESRLWHKESSCTGGQESDFSLYHMQFGSTYFSQKNHGFILRLKAKAVRMAHNILRKKKTMSPERYEMVLKAQREGIKCYKRTKKGGVR